MAKVNTGKFETAAQFLARGGKITKLPTVGAPISTTSWYKYKPRIVAKEVVSLDDIMARATESEKAKIKELLGI